MLHFFISLLWLIGRKSFNSVRRTAAHPKTNANILAAHHTTFELFLITLRPLIEISHTYVVVFGRLVWLTLYRYYAILFYNPHKTKMKTFWWATEKFPAAHKSRNTFKPYVFNNIQYVRYIVYCWIFWKGKN